MTKCTLRQLNPLDCKCLAKMVFHIESKKEKPYKWPLQATPSSASLFFLFNWKPRTTNKKESIVLKLKNRRTQRSP